MEFETTHQQYIVSLFLSIYKVQPKLIHLCQAAMENKRLKFGIIEDTDAYCMAKFNLICMVQNPKCNRGHSPTPQIIPHPMRKFNGVPLFRFSTD
jgi:hypothetical protein